MKTEGETGFCKPEPRTPGAPGAETGVEGAPIKTSEGGQPCQHDLRLLATRTERDYVSVILSP